VSDEDLDEFVAIGDISASREVECAVRHEAQHEKDDDEERNP
jgi:hypothetical protein